MVNNYILNKVLDKIKKIIGIERFEDPDKILIVTDDKLPHDINLKHVLILMTCVFKEDDKFYLKLVLEEASLEV